MSSLFERMKETLHSAGKGAKKLTRIGQLKLDLLDAESKLADRYKALGKACANRFLERGEQSVEVTDPAFEQLLREIEAAQKQVEQVQAELEEARLL